MLFSRGVTKCLHAVTIVATRALFPGTLSYEEPYTKNSTIDDEVSFNRDNPLVVHLFLHINI